MSKNPSFEVHCASQCFIPGEGFDSKRWFKEASTEATSMLKQQPDRFSVDHTGLISFRTTLRGAGHAKETLIALLARVDPSTQDIADFVVLLDPTV